MSANDVLICLNPHSTVVSIPTNYFEARVTTLVVSKKSWTTIFDMYPVFYPYCFQQTGTTHANCPTLTKEQMRKSNVVVATLTLGKAHWYCEKNSPSHWKQDDMGKLGGLPVPIEKTALLYRLCNQIFGCFFLEMECHMLSLPVQVAQRSSSLAVHKSPTL